jgi:hypothetical protein
VRILRPSSAAVLIGLIPAWAGASPFLDAAEFLNGSWRGDDFVLRVDSHRAQASVDPKRPFEWDRFVIREVTGDEVVFVIGAELFEAKRRDEEIVLTGTSFQGERVLAREVAAPSP